MQESICCDKTDQKKMKGAETETDGHTHTHTRSRLTAADQSFGISGVKGH